jgi:hypothetical protein
MRTGVAPWIALLLFVAIAAGAAVVLSPQGMDMAAKLRGADSAKGADKAAEGTAASATPQQAGSEVRAGEESASNCLEAAGLPLSGTSVRTPRGGLATPRGLRSEARSIDELESLRSLAQSFAVHNRCDFSVTIGITSEGSELRVSTPDGSTVEAGKSVRVGVTNAGNLRRIYDNDQMLAITTFSTLDYLPIRAVTELKMPVSTVSIGKPIMHADYGIWLVDVQDAKATFKITAAGAASATENVRDELAISEGGIGRSSNTLLRIALFKVDAPGRSAVVAVDTRIAAPQDILSIELVRQMRFSFADGTAASMDALSISSADKKAFSVSAEIGGLIKQVETGTVYLATEQEGEYYVFDEASGHYGRIAERGITGALLPGKVRLYGSVDIMIYNAEAGAYMTMVDGRFGGMLWKFKIAGQEGSESLEAYYTGDMYADRRIAVGFESKAGSVLKELSATRAVIALKR